MRHKFLVLCILTLFMGSVTILFIAEAEAARRSSSSSRSSSRSSSYKSRSYKSSNSKSNYNRSHSSKSVSRNMSKSMLSSSGYTRPARLGAIAAVGSRSMPSTYSKPGKYGFGFKKKKRKGYDDDDFDDAFIGVALGLGAGSLLGYLINDEEGDENDEGMGGFTLIIIWILLAVIIKLLRMYFKKKSIANGRLDRKLLKAKNRKEEATC